MIEFITKNNKIIGSIIGDTYFSKREEQHIMQKWNAFGISEKVLLYLEEKNIHTIVIVFNGMNLRSSLYSFMLSKLSHNFEDNDLQRFRRIEDMEQIKYENPLYQ